MVLIQPLVVSPQMPQVMDSSSEGIDLHFWTRVLKAISEKLQTVSSPKFITKLQLSVVLTQKWGIRVRHIFSSAGNTPHPLFCV